VHIPGLQSLSIFRGKLTLDEFGMTDTGGYDGAAIRDRRLSADLKTYVEKFFREIRSEEVPSIEDVFWITITYADKYGQQRGLFIHPSTYPDTIRAVRDEVYLSLLLHLRTTPDNRDFRKQLVVIVERMLTSCKSCIPELLRELPNLARRMNQKFGKDECNRILSLCLVLFPPRELHTELVSLGASVDVAMSFGADADARIMIAAGTAQHDYVRLHLQPPPRHGCLHPFVGYEVTSAIEAAAMADDVQMIELLFEFSSTKEIQTAMRQAISRCNKQAYRFLDEKMAHNPDTYPELITDAVHDLTTAEFLVTETKHPLRYAADYSVWNLGIMEYFHTNRVKMEIVGCTQAVEDPKCLIYRLNALDQKSITEEIGRDIDLAIKHDNGPCLRSLLNVALEHSMDMSEFIDHAAVCGNIGITRLLLCSGADINKRNKWNGMTPLLRFLYSCSVGSRMHSYTEDYLLWLFSQGADVLACDNHGISAWLYSRELDDLSPLIESQMADVWSRRHCHV